MIIILKQPKTSIKFCKHKTNRDQSVNIKEGSSEGSEDVHLKKRNCSSASINCCRLQSRPMLAPLLIFQERQKSGFYVKSSLLLFFFKELIIVKKKHCVGNEKKEVRLLPEFGPPSVVCKDLSGYKTSHNLSSRYLFNHIDNTPTIYTLDYTGLHILLPICFFFLCLGCLLDSHNIYLSTTFYI